MGARFLPCMQKTNITGSQCPPGIIPQYNSQFMVLNNNTKFIIDIASVDNSLEKRKFTPDFTPYQRKNNTNVHLNNTQIIAQNINNTINNQFPQNTFNISELNQEDNTDNNQIPINNTDIAQNSLNSNMVGRSTKQYCSIADICGLGMKNGEKPNQWYRFITPMFLHGGILHILFNLIFQIRTGFPMEKEYGSFRMFVIYMVSGIFGFIFEAKSVGYTPSVGCSGALYGLLACLLLDLIQSWKIILHPWKELLRLLFIIIISFSFGLIPYIDNFAHIGGFIMGLLMGIIFIPYIVFSKKGLIIKRCLMVISFFTSIFLYIWALQHFYLNGKVCKWCKYLSCLPIKEGWCEYGTY